MQDAKASFDHVFLVGNPVENALSGLKHIANPQKCLSDSFLEYMQMVEATNDISGFHFD
jgi:hypothetical protein